MLLKGVLAGIHLHCFAIHFVYATAMIRPATVLIQLAGYCSMSNRRDTLYAQQSRSVIVPLAVRVGGVVSLSLSFTWLAPLSSPLFSLHLLFTTARNYNAKQSVTVTLHLSWLLDKH